MKCRKLTLAVEDASLRDELSALLRSQDVEVEFVATDAEVGQEAHVLVVRAEDLEHGDERLAEAGGDGAPGVVVLGSERATEEARLVAAGASAVLDTELPEGMLQRRLVELVESEADGGVQGPDSGGAQPEPRLADFQSTSPCMRDFLEIVDRVADTDSTLLVTGETGVGKERLARAIHAESGRAQRPFVSINCGALPENLLESELFGHDRGAFTGATADRKGRFEEADGGTLFLDEVGEMPAHLQVKLLTVLQRREIQRVGGEGTTAVDVRVISATNRDLNTEVAEGRFREDLLFRLNVVALEIPPLRERLEDLPQLLGRFLRHFADVHGRPDVTAFEEPAMRRLLAHSWPGNVRELVNVVERAVLLCRGTRIEVRDLQQLDVAFGGSQTSSSSRGAALLDSEPDLLNLPLVEARGRVVEAFEEAYLRQLLQDSAGAIGATARRAGINPRTLYEKMRRYALRKEDFSA